MKKNFYAWLWLIVWVLFFLLHPFPAHAYISAAKFTVVNVGTNTVSITFWDTASGPSGAGCGTLLAGQSTSFTNGTSCATAAGLTLGWGPTGDCTHYNLSIGQAGGGGCTGSPTIQNLGTFNVKSDGTNCTYSFPVCNGDSVTHNYEVFVDQNGTPSGGVFWVTVNANACVTVTWQDNSCMGGGYHYQRIDTMDRPPILGGPPQKQAGGSVTPGGVDPGATTSGPGFNSGTAAQNGGGGSGPANDSGPTPPPYNPGTNGGSGSNGPITYPTNTIPGGSTNPVTGGTVIVGLDALYSAVTKAGANTVNAIRQGASDTTNTILSEGKILHEDLTNILGAFTNLNRTNVVDTNAFDVTTATNTGATMAQGEYAGISDAINGAVVAGNSSTGIGAMSVTVGTSTLNLNPFSNTSIAAIGGWMKTVFTWLVVYGYGKMAWDSIETYLASSAGANQARTSGQTVLGTNLNAPSALAMAAVITIALGAIPGAFVAYLSSTHFLDTILLNPFAGVAPAVATGVGMINQVFPVDVAVGASVSYLIFRMSLGGLYFVATSIVRWAVGL